MSYTHIILKVIKYQKILCESPQRMSAQSVASLWTAKREPHQECGGLYYKHLPYSISKVLHRRHKRVFYLIVSRCSLIQSRQAQPVSNKDGAHILRTHYHLQNHDTTEQQGFPMNVNYPIQSIVLDLLALRWKEKLTQTLYLIPNGK